MPATVAWEIEERVLYVCVTGILTIEEIYAADAESGRRFATGTAPIHLIVEHVNVDRIPGNIQGIRTAMAHLGHVKQGWTILVSPHRSIWSYVGQIIAQMAMVPFRRFDTLDDALAFLHEADPSLNRVPVQETVHRGKGRLTPG